MSVVDRIALSRELADLAERFALEAGAWRLPEARRECERTARHLAELSRVALWQNSDTEKLQHYATAAHLLANHLEGTRRFFKIILTPPASRAERTQTNDH